MKKSIEIRTLSALTVLIAGSVFGAVASAQQLEEILVTAERREANLQDVPLAVTALTQKTIEDNDIHDLTDIATRVPGLTFSPFSPGQNIVSLRGASSNDDGAGTENSVALFVDDVYLGRVSNINPEMFDIESIEVLRGPQGTLYGRNTIGGAIVVRSTRPNTESVEGKIRLNVGNFDRIDVAGLLTGPLSERWAGKVSAISRQRDGWARNVFLNKDQKDEDTLAARAQLLYSGDLVEGTFTADYNRLDVEDMGRIPVNTGEPGDPAFWAFTGPGSRGDLCAGRGADCVAGPVDGYAERDAWGASAKLVWDLPAGQLTSITAYRENESDWNMDSTGTPVPDPAITGGNAALAQILFGLVNDDILENTEQITQELRWSSTIGDDTSYVIGFWYLNEETERTECFDNDPTPSDCTPSADGGATDWYRQVNETDSFALFSQFDWVFRDGWNLSVGGRYSFDEKQIANEANAGDFVVINQSFANTVEEDWSAFTGKVAVSYAPNDSVNIYAQVAQGFKSGGFPAAPQGIEFTNPLAQEEALNIELGVKAEITDAFRVNLAAFNTDYEDLQIQTFGPASPAAAFGTFQTFNSGDAEIAGIEMEAIWAVTGNLTVSGFYALQSSEFGETDIVGTAFPNQEGQDLFRTPEVKYNFNIDYEKPLGNGSIVNFLASYRYTDDQRGELEPWAIQPEFDLLDARVSWTSPTGRLELALWGKNLGDEEYVTHLYTIANSVVAVFGNPRMYGVTGTFSFD